MLSLFVLLSPALPHAAEEGNAQRYAACTALVGKDAKRALSLAEGWTASAPGDFAPRHCRALALFALEKYPEAAEDLENLMRMAPKEQASLWVNIAYQAGIARDRAGALEAARRDFSQALAEASATPSLAQAAALIRHERASMLARSGKRFEAVQDYDAILAQNPEDAAALMARASLLMEMGEYALARGDYRRALEADSRHDKARKGLYAASAAHRPPRR